MNDRLKSHLDKIFGPYADFNNVKELKEELYSDLQERYSELKAEGRDDETGCYGYAWLYRSCL